MTNRNPINGHTLIEWGFTPGPWFAPAISVANRLADSGHSIKAIIANLRMMEPGPTLPLQTPPNLHMNLEANTQDELTNLAAVQATMTEVMRTPTVVNGAVMPDACPAGPHGTIPVGGIIAASNAIHPGMHSADICCSVAISILPPGSDPKTILDRAMQVTHFGGGGRNAKGFIDPPAHLFEQFAGNPFLAGLETDALEHFATQGDGNHFLYVGYLESTGDVVLVTHHGSRRPGAMLYKRGMTVAEKYRKRLSPETLKQNAWIPADSQDGENYWNALQIIRQWTKANHYAIHNLIEPEPLDRWWNEHNFVFQRDGLYYHAKGATPAWESSVDESAGFRLIPLNMAEPVLIIRGLDNDLGLGFAPHGAGRNFSRREHTRRQDENLTEAEIVVRETQGLDVRFYSGHPDIGELPSAYKSANEVQRQIEHYGLATIEDRVLPYGCIMAGEWRRNK